MPDDKDTAAFRALADIMPFVLGEYYENCALPDFRKAVEAAKAVLGKAPVEHLSGTCPLILYFANETDREEFVAAVQEAKPQMQTLSI